MYLLKHSVNCRSNALCSGTVQSLGQLCCEALRDSIESRESRSSVFESCQKTNKQTKNPKQEPRYELNHGSNLGLNPTMD